MGSVAVARRDWTYRDLVALPEDRLRHELFDGEHVVTPSPRVDHQIVHANLFEALASFVSANGAGQLLSAPLDVRFSPATVLQPDLLYYAGGRFRASVSERCAIAAPDLVIEIASAGTRRRDKGRKRAIYEREGVGEYWIADPDTKQVAVFRRHAGGAAFTNAASLFHERDDAIESPLFPGLRIPLSRVFRGI